MKQKRTLVLISMVVIISVLVIPLVTLSPARAASLITNPSFETGSGADASDWIEGTDHVRSSDRAHTGTYSLKSTYTGSQSITTTASLGDLGAVTIYISFWGYRESETGAAFLSVTGDGWSGDDFYLSTSTGYWEYVSGSTVVANATGTMIQLITENMGGTVYFDDVCASTTESDCLQSTDTPTFTPTSTETYTPTQTYTPTETYTPTTTETYTPTPTNTATPTLNGTQAFTATYQAAVDYYSGVASQNYPTVIGISALCGFFFMVGLIVIAIKGSSRR